MGNPGRRKFSFPESFLAELPGERTAGGVDEFAVVHGIAGRVDDVTLRDVQ